MTEPSDNLRMLLDAPASVRAGSTVPLVLHVENTGSAPVDLYLRGREVSVDLVVTSAAGVRVFHLLEGAVVPAVVQIRTLRPRERLEHALTWSARDARGRALEPGRYALRVALLREDEPLEVERQIQVD